MYQNNFTVAIILLLLLFCIICLLCNNTNISTYVEPFNSNMNINENELNILNALANKEAWRIAGRIERNVIIDCVHKYHDKQFLLNCIASYDQYEELFDATTLNLYNDLKQLKDPTYSDRTDEITTIGQKLFINKINQVVSSILNLLLNNAKCNNKLNTFDQNNFVRLMIDNFEIAIKNVIFETYNDPRLMSDQPINDKENIYKRKMEEMKNCISQCIANK